MARYDPETGKIITDALPLFTDQDTRGLKSFRPKWEYEIFVHHDDCDPTDIVETLNKFGSDGWELITVRSDEGYYPTFYFKRQKVEE